MWIFLVLLANISAFAFTPLDPELQNFKYPFKVTFHEIKFGEQSLRMAYMDESPEKPNGKTIVLLHGKNFSGNYWEQTAKDLLKLGYRVIMPDQIGFGKSSKPQSFPYTFQLLSQLTQQIIESKKIKKFYLIGHSMGGMLATRMALMYPDQVEKLLLVNPIGLEDWKLSVPYKNVQEIYQQELKSNPGTIREYQRVSYFDGQWAPAYEKGIDILAGWTLHHEYPRIAWNAALTADMIFTQPVIYEFSQLKMPTLLLIGTRDRTALGKAWVDQATKERLGRYDLLGKEVIKLIPKGKLVELPGIGHMPQVEAYSQYWKALQSFL